MVQDFLSGVFLSALAGSRQEQTPEEVQNHDSTPVPIIQVWIIVGPVCH